MAEQIVAANPPSLTYTPISFSFGALKPNPYSQNHATRAYRSYVVRTEYDIESGLRVMANGGVNASKPTQNEVIREHNGFTKKRVWFVGYREGAKLVLPSPNTSNPNEILERTVITGEVPFQMPNIQIQHVEGYYEYGLIQSLDITTDTLPMGVTDADNNAPSATSQNILPADFDTRLLNAAHAVPGGFQFGIPLLPKGPA